MLAFTWPPILICKSKNRNKWPMNQIQATDDQQSNYLDDRQSNYHYLFFSMKNHVPEEPWYCQYSVCSLTLNLNTEKNNNVNVRKGCAEYLCITLGISSETFKRSQEIFGYLRVIFGHPPVIFGSRNRSSKSRNGLALAVRLVKFGLTQWKKTLPNAFTKSTFSYLFFVLLVHQGACSVCPVQIWSIPCLHLLSGQHPNNTRSTKKIKLKSTVTGILLCSGQFCAKVVA